MKYGELLRPGETAADVVLAERRREQAIRDQGWQVARWLWEDLYRPGAVRDPAAPGLPARRCLILHPLC
ncbi:hypothetical protein [Microlunatus ginsengisoli]|uniref:Uncharacterized protein n=1 Tax=Microlunatus ginsengisoli TaxID=363863 RepID=A0ABP6ZIJ6_9ACTN